MIVPKKLRLKNKKIPLDLRQEKVDSKGYLIITVHKHVTKTRKPFIPCDNCKKNEV